MLDSGFGLRQVCPGTRPPPSPCLLGLSRFLILLHILDSGHKQELRGLELQVSELLYSRPLRLARWECASGYAGTAEKSCHTSSRLGGVRVGYSFHNTVPQHAMQVRGWLRNDHRAQRMLAYRPMSWA